MDNGRFDWAAEVEAEEASLDTILEEERARKRPTTSETVVQTLQRAHNLVNLRPHKLFCNHNYIENQASVTIPEMAQYVNVEKTGDDYTWYLDLPEDIQEHVSTTTLSKNVTRRELVKLRHEFVSEAFHLGGTDQRLDMIYDSVDDDQNKLTPDFMVKDELGVVHVIEIATTKAVDKTQIDKIVQDKLFKYENALFLRSKQFPTTLSVVVVNHSSVCSTMPLSQELVDDIMIRYRIMIGLEAVASGKGYQLFPGQTDEALNKMSLDIFDSLKSISPDESIAEDGVNITTGFIKDCLKPVDHGVVREAFATSMMANPAMKPRDWSTANDEAAKEKQSKDYHDRVERHLINFRKGFDKEPERRTERVRPVLNVPNIIPARTEPSTLVQFRSVGECKLDRDLSTLWKSAFACVSSEDHWKEATESELLVEAQETRKEALDSIKKKRKERMKKRARVTVPVKPGSRIAQYLASDGIKGKNTKNDVWRKLRRKEQSKTLRYNTATEDIDDYLSSQELYSKMDREMSATQQRVLELAAIANDYAQNTSKGLDIIKDWEGTKLMEYAHFVSDLSAELTVSLRQHTKRGEMLLKKLRNYNCYLLLAPAGLKSPIGVSIMIPKAGDVTVLQSFLGRDVLETNNCYLTKFITAAPDKLENWYNLPNMVISLISYLSYHYTIRNPTVSECLKTIDFTKMLNYMVAIRLEDKAETEETITQTRYMYMEAMRSTAPLVKPEPLKVLSKLSDMPRSRLNLWTIKQVITTFSHMSEHIPKRQTMNDSKKDIEDDDPLPTDTWNGLINFITNHEVPSASTLLNLFYIGYLKNKNNDAQANTNWALLEKTLKEEFSIDWDNLSAISGKADPKTLPKSHQFNLECVKAGSEALEKRLLSRYGPEWKSHLNTKILNALSRLSTFSLATLKASSTTTDSDVKKPMTRTNNTKVKRRKVLSAIVANVGLFGINPFRKIHKFINIRMKGSKKARTDLFKKQQHGGLREIFVMDEVTRVIQLFVETCARSICSEFEEESLTNPKKKLPIINNHFRKAKRYSNKSDRLSVNYNSSMDKTRWSQGFVIRAMSVTLFRMTDPSLHGALQKALNMWIGKNVKIPPEVIDLLLNDVRLSSPAYERLRQEFYGLKKIKSNERPILDFPRSGYLTLRTGFMQGILHYTSSLVHLGFLSLMKTMMTNIVETTMEGCSVLISFACSSDDSAVMVTLFYPKESQIINKKWVDYADQIERLLHTLEIFCLFYCMRPSTKSAVAMMDSVEFNSEFIFNNTLAVPIIKFVTSSQNVVPYESFIDKLQGHYNLLSDLASSGLPSFNVHLCQLAQLMLHYKSLGYGFTPLETRLHNLMVATTDPNLGFFPLDSELCPGVMGFPFTQYMVSKSTGVLPISGKMMRKEPMTVGEDGAVSETLQILHGDRRKQKKILLDIHDQENGIIRTKKSIEDPEVYTKLLDKIAEESRADVDAHYELFYRAAETDSDLYCKLKLKVLMPGVAKSLMSSNTFVQTVSVSLYSAHTDCITVSTERIPKNRRTMGDESKTVFDKKRTKMSLIAALTIKSNEEAGKEGHDTGIAALESVCFPLLARYKECLNVIRSYRNCIELEASRFRKQKNRMDIIPLRGKLPLTLLEVVKSIWFGHDCRSSKTVLRRCLEIYMQQFPWLKETHDDSLKLSPFASASEMFGFLNSVGENMRSFVAVTPSVRSTKLSSQLNQYIAKNYKSCVVLKRPGEKKCVAASPKRARNCLDLALLIPLKTERESKVYSIMQEMPFLDDDVTNPRELNRRDLSLHLIQSFETKKMSGTEISSIVRDTRLGYHLFYLKEQNKRVDSEGNVTWHGTGEVMIHAGDDFIIATIIDDRCVSLHVETIQSILRNLHSLKLALEEMGVRPTMTLESGRAMLGKYNGDRVVHKTGRGCPIFKDYTTKKTITDLPDLHTHISKGVISLKYRIGKDRFANLVKYSVRLSDIDLMSMNRIRENVWDAWVSCELWEFTKCRKTLGDLKDKITDWSRMASNWRLRGDRQLSLQNALSELKEYKDFLAITLRYRLGQRKSLKLNPEDYLSTINGGENQDALDLIDEDMLLELQMGAFEYGEPSSVMEGTTTITTQNPFYQLLDLSEEDVDDVNEVIQHFSEMLDSDMTNMTRLITERLGDNPLSSIINRGLTLEFRGDYTELIHRPTNTYSNHPLWDALINEADQKDKRMMTNVMNGIVVGYDPELSRLLLWLLDIPEKTAASGLRGPDSDYTDPVLLRMKRLMDSLADREGGEEDSCSDSD